MIRGGKTNILTTIRQYFNGLFVGHVTILGNKLPKAMISGITAVICMYVGVAGIASIVVPWGNISDTQYHVDYIWQVRQGELPTFGEGMQYPPFRSEMNQDRHLVASHPPLFYLLHAPVTGHLLNQGAWQKAIAVGRGLNVLIGVLCVMALSWAGWTFGGRRKALFAVSVPALAALMFRFTTLNSVFGNDALIVLFSTLTFVLMYRILNEGLRRRYLLYLTILSILGMATKAPYIVILGVCLLSIVFASVLHGKNTKNRNIVNGALVAAILAIVVAIAIGWFYYRNYQASGSWFKSSPDSFSGGRPYQSFKDVVTGSRLWALFYSHSSNTPLFSTALTSFAAAGILMSTTKKKLREVADNKPLRIIYALMVIATLGVFATQIRLAVGYGSINFRYMLPVLLPFSLVLAYGLLAFKNIRAQLVATASVFMGAITILQTASSTAVLRQVPEVSKFDNGIGKVFVAASSNGIPVIGTASLIVLFLLGSILLIISLYKLSVSSRN